MLKKLNAAFYLFSAASIFILIVGSLFASLYYGGFPNVYRLPWMPPIFLLLPWPYLALVCLRHKGIFSWITQGVVSTAFSLFIACIFFDELTTFFWIVFLTLGVVFYFVANLKDIEPNPEYGEYPLVLDAKRQYGIPTHSAHENIQIVGGTGAGKTHYVIKPFIEQNIAQGLGCFIYDVKGNLDKDVNFYMTKGHRSDDAFHFNLLNPSASNTFNPLYGDDPDAIANRLHTALYYDNRNAEPHYVALAEAYLLNLIGLLKKEIKTLTFMDILIPTEEAETFRTIQWLCDRHPDSGYTRHFKNIWLWKSPKQRQDELFGLVIKLQRFCNSGWAHLLNTRTPDVTMQDVVRNNRVFLFAPNAVQYPGDAKPLAIMAMMALAEQSSERKLNPKKKPFRIFLDEFYNLAYDRFIDFINKCRDSEMNLILAHQSLGDLTSVSPDFKEQVMNAANNKIILRLNDPVTAEAFARVFGTEPDKDYQVESYTSDGTLAGYAKPKVEKFRFHPNLIKEQKVGQAVVRIAFSDRIQLDQVSLAPATPIPEDFNGRNFHPYRAALNKKIDCSVIELMANQGTAPKKSLKGPGGLMGGNDAV